MSDDVSRRDFIKVAGTTVGAAIATSYAPLSYAANEKVRVGCIGTGGQGSFHIRYGLSSASNIQIVAVCDVFRPHLEGAYQVAGGGDIKKYMDYREMLEKEQLDAVVIATPLHTHFQITSDCLDAGKFCFTEKTMCYDLEQSRELVRKCHQTGLFVQVGHQRRVNPMYNKAMMLARTEGVLGRINHIMCQWHRNDDWRRPVNLNYQLSPEEARWITNLERHLNWRIYREYSGGLMTELATHQLDIAAWFLDTMPSRVTGYGGLDYWRDGRTVFDNVNLVYEFDITPESRGYRAINARNPYQDRRAINEPYTVRAAFSYITANGQKGASEMIEGDQGAFQLTETGGLFFPEATAEVRWADQGMRDADAQNASIITSGGTREMTNKALANAKEITVDNDKSVDQLQFESFANNIMYGGAPRANVMVGMRASVMALAGMKALRERTQVEIDPAWYTFDFPTDDPSVFG